MDKYETEGSSWWSDSDYRYYEEKASESLAKVIYEDGDTHKFSGLYNSKGQKLYKVKQKQKLGFW